jgi:hypothetical protein
LVSTQNLVNLLSSPNLISTTAGLERYISSFIDPQELASSIRPFISTPNLTNLVSTANLINLVSTANLTNLVSTTYLDTQVASTVRGLGTAGYLSSVPGVVSTPNLTNLVSTQNLINLVSTQNLLNLLSSPNLISTTAGLEQYISSFIDPAELASSIRPFISTPNLTNLVSTANLINLVSTANLTNVVSTSYLDTQMASTVRGLGTAGYVSTSQLLSTSFGLYTQIQAAAASVTGSQLTSTTVGLGTLGYVSSISGVVSTPNLLNLVSTQNLINLVSTSLLNSQLNSTVIGLGTVGYISSASLASTMISSLASVGRFFSSLSSSYAQNFTTQTANISATTTSSILIGVGDGFLAMPDIRPTSVSTLIMLTSSLRAFDLQIGAVSSLNSIEFFGLQGNFNNTVIAEMSTGAGTQELLFFKGSSVSDQIRFQTTGIFEVETGVSARLWPRVPQNAIPSFIIDTASNVGIQTATPQATLDVAGTGRFQIVSTLALNVSSITGISFITPGNLLNLVSTPNLLNLVSTSYLSSQLNSTVVGLGTVGYVSSFFNISSISAQQVLVSSIGIGCNAPYYQLDIVGTAHANIFSSFTTLASSYTGNLGDAQTLILWEV